MCKCTPEIRTPWCGRAGCEEPERSKEKEVAALLSKMSPESVTILLQVLDNPKRGMWALDLMISRSADVESKKRFLSLKHSLERYALEIDPTGEESLD